MLEGRATFTVDGEELDAPAGTCVLVDVGHACARRSPPRPDTTRARRSAAGPAPRCPCAPFEHYYAAAARLRRRRLRPRRRDRERGPAPTGPTTRSSTTSWPASTRLAGRLDEARRSLDDRLRRRRAHARVGGARTTTSLRCATGAASAVAVRPARSGRLPSLGDAALRRAVQRTRLAQQPLELGDRRRGRRVMHRRHAELARRLEVERQVVDEHARRSAASADALGAELVDRGSGLRMPSSPEMTTPSNSSAKQVARS